MSMAAILMFDKKERPDDIYDHRTYLARISGGEYAMGDAHRILVVDDEFGPREALRMILKAKYQVMTAVSGPDALQMIRKIPPELVLLDIKMRDMSGIEVLQAIKEVDANIEVIMMTAYASLQTAREAMAHGASEYLIKPFSKKEVEEAIAKALRRRATRPGAPPDVRTLLEQLRTLAHTSTTAPTTPAVDTRAAGALAQLHHLLGASGAALALRDNASAPWHLSLIHEVPPAARGAFDTPAWVAHLAQALTSDQTLDATGRAAAHQPALPQSLAALGYTGALLCPLPLGPTTAGVLILLGDRPQAVAARRFGPGPDSGGVIGPRSRHSAARPRGATRSMQQAQRAAQLSILRAIADVISANKSCQQHCRRWQPNSAPDLAMPASTSGSPLLAGIWRKPIVLVVTSAGGRTSAHRRL